MAHHPARRPVHPPAPTPPQPAPYSAVFSSTNGVGGFTFKGKATSPDWGIAFDGASSGVLDHLLFYNAGSGECAVVRPKPDGAGMQSVYYTRDGGLGGFDFKFWYDKAFAYDFDHSGKQDHIFCYRPGAGAVFIMKHSGRGVFSPVYAMPGAARATAKVGVGIGGWGMRYNWDLCFAFDYDHTRKMDAICIYRRALKRFWILKHEGDKFVPVYKNNTAGIGGWAMGIEQDYAWAYDYGHTGCQDHILFLRYTQMNARIVAHHAGNKFVTVFLAAGPGGLGSFGPAQKSMSIHDNIIQPYMTFVYDHEHTKKNTHIVFYLPGKGICYIVTSEPNSKQFTAVYRRGPRITEAGSFGLKSVKDRLFPMDFDGNGCLDHIVAYTQGSGSIQILRRGQKPPPVELHSPQTSPLNAQVTGPGVQVLPPQAPQWGQQEWTAADWEQAFQGGNEGNEDHPNIGHNGWPPAQSVPAENISGGFVPSEETSAEDPEELEDMQN